MDELDRLAREILRERWDAFKERVSSLTPEKHLILTYLLFYSLVLQTDIGRAEDILEAALSDAECH